MLMVKKKRPHREEWGPFVLGGKCLAAITTAAGQLNARVLGRRFRRERVGDGRMVDGASAATILWRLRDSRRIGLLDGAAVATVAGKPAARASAGRSRCCCSPLRRQRESWRIGL